MANESPDESSDMVPDESSDMVPDESPDVAPDESPNVAPDESSDVAPDEASDREIDRPPSGTQRLKDWAERVELQRRMVHACGVGFPLLYILGLVSWTGLGIALVAGTLGVTILEYLRLVAGWNHAIYERLTRPYEQDNVAGYALYMVGMLLVWVVFDPVPALAGMLALALGDPVSGAMSSSGAGDRKRVSVLAAMFLVSFALAAPLTIGVAGLRVGLVAAAGGALGATLADGMTPVIRGYVVDDNLTIPPATALGIASVFLVVGVESAV